MEYLLTFLYTARTTITPSNVQMLLEAANLFQIDLLKRKCTDFMYKQLDPCNCLGMKVSLYRAPVSDTLILTGTLVTGTLGKFISTGIQYAAYLFQRAFWLKSTKPYMMIRCPFNQFQAFADAHGLEKLGIAAENMILEKFMDLVEYEEFLTMPKEMLIEVIKQDSLEVHDELIVFRHGF